MNRIESTRCEVTNVDYDMEKDCFFVDIHSRVLVPVWTGSKMEYQERNRVYLEFSLVEVSDISVGDIITIETYEHVAGDTIETFNGGIYTFESAGLHHLIIEVETPSADEGCPTYDDDDDECDEDFDEAAYNAMMRDQAEEFKKAEKSMIVQNYLRDYTKPCALDPNEEGASNSFAGALVYASNVFINRLILGGAYSTNQDDKTIILEHLKAIMDIIKKYQK